MSAPIRKGGENPQAAQRRAPPLSPPLPASGRALSPEEHRALRDRVLAELRRDGPHVTPYPEATASPPSMPSRSGWSAAYEPAARFTVPRIPDPPPAPPPARLKWGVPQTERYSPQPLTTVKDATEPPPPPPQTPRDESDSITWRELWMHIGIFAAAMAALSGAMLALERFA